MDLNGRGNRRDVCRQQMPPAPTQAATAGRAAGPLRRFAIVDKQSPAPSRPPLFFLTGGGSCGRTAGHGHVRASAALDRAGFDVAVSTTQLTVTAFSLRSPSAKASPGR